MNNLDLLGNAYLGGKKSNSYNFNLFEMMNDFDFYEFCDEIRSINDYTREHGAMLVITDKQYILCYNSSFGIGTHMGAKARIYIDLHGGGLIENQEKAFELSSRCASQYICARIEYECSGMDYDNRPKYFGQINFETTMLHENRKITEGMFNNWKQFYNDYNDDIELTCKHFNFAVAFSYCNESGEVITDYSSNLDNLYNHLKSVIDVNLQVDEDEVIIGRKVNCLLLNRRM